MTRGRPKKIQDTNEVIQINEEILLKDYDLQVPSENIFIQEEFDPKRLSKYEWINKGTLLSSGKRLVCIEIRGLT